MKTRMILAYLAVFFASFGLCLAGEPQMGTWKLNEAKSKLNPSVTEAGIVADTLAALYNLQLAT